MSYYGGLNVYYVVESEMTSSYRFIFFVPAYLIPEWNENANVALRKCR